MNSNRPIQEFYTCLFWCIIQVAVLSFIIATIWGVSLGFLGAFGIISGVPTCASDMVMITTVTLVLWRQMHIIDQIELEIPAW